MKNGMDLDDPMDEGIDKDTSTLSRHMQKFGGGFESLLNTTESVQY